MITKTLNIDLDSLQIISFGFSYKSNELDYALISNSESVIWYDKDIGFKLKKSCADTHKVCDLSYQTNNEVIEIKLYELKDSYVSKRSETTIPLKNYTEETFFMESTLFDFGAFTYEHYSKLLKLVHKCKELIKVIENENKE